MPTSSSKPLITAPLSLVPTEAHQPPGGSTMLSNSVPRAPPRLSPCPYGPLPLPMAAPTPSCQPHPHSSRPQGMPCAMGTLALVFPSSQVPVPCLFTYVYVHACVPITTVEWPGRCSLGLAGTSSFPPPPWPLLRIPEHVVMGIDVQTLAGAIQNASVTHHGTPDAVPKQLPGAEQLGALGAIQKAQGGDDVCGLGQVGRYAEGCQGSSGTPAPPKRHRG